MKENDQNKIDAYFQRYFDKEAVDLNLRLSQLGFTSLDYLELNSFLLKNFQHSFDITRIYNSTKISDLLSYLHPVADEKKIYKNVELDKLQAYNYTYQLNNKNAKVISYVIHYLKLKNNLDLTLLEQSIRETLDNHFILNSKLIRMIDSYYFEPTIKQEALYYKNLLGFNRLNLDQLKINVHANRLVNIYLHKTKGEYYLIFAFHHAALDGWSCKLVLEEIFRRYLGYNIKNTNQQAEIQQLNLIYKTSLNQPVNLDEFAQVFSSIDPKQYNQLGYLFNDVLQYKTSCVMVNAGQIKEYGRCKGIDKFPYSVITVILVYTFLSRLAGDNKVTLYTSFSNRFLPLPDICELVGNFVTGLPLFLEKGQQETVDFAGYINETLKVYFKHMNYGAITRILMERKTLLNTFMSPYRQPYFFMLSYINDASKIAFGTKSILNEYINWPQSKSYIYDRGGRFIFFHVEHLNNSLIFHVQSSATKGVHERLINLISEVIGDC